MGFLNPWGLLFALFIPGVILLYLLKQQCREVRVSSTFLWEETLENLGASRHWQKLRQNLLLLLQIVAIALFTLTIARPYVACLAEGQDYIVLIDSSGSMQAEDVKPSRFEKAKDHIRSLIEGMLPGEEMTLIAVGNQVQVVANRTDDKGVLIKKLNELKVTNGGSNFESAFSLVRAMLRENGDTQIYVYSDKYFRFDDENYHCIVLQKNGENRAVVEVSHAAGPGGYIVLSQIANYGDDATVTLECLADGHTVDVKEVSIPAGKTVPIYWKDIPDAAKQVEIKILDRDDMMADNRGWEVINEQKTTRALFVTRRNAFIEKAAGLYPGLEIVKTTPEHADGIGGYDLYIYDGYVPTKFPKDGAVIIFNPQSENALLQVEGEFRPGAARRNVHSSYGKLLRYVQVEQFHIARARVVSIPEWGEWVFGDSRYPLMIAGEVGNQRIAIFPFDLHFSDVPLKPDFPILIQNLLSWMLPPVVGGDTEHYAGEEVVINPLPHASAIRVISPSKKSFDIAPPFPVSAFSNTDEVGIYEVEQEAGGKVVKGYFVVQFPVHSESNLRATVKLDGGEDMDKTMKKPKYRKELWYYSGFLLLLLILVEWWVYQRGY